MNEQIGNKINDKTYIKLTPFKGFVLENFPFIEADFDAITNYQLLCKVIEYLNNVISNQNTVQELGTDLVNAYNSLVDAVNLAIGEFEDSITTDFNTLHDYVYNYFDNLDVQEEINNKLDDMVEAGTLQEIVADYLNSKAIFGFDNVLAMKNSTNLIDGSYAKTLGYYSKNDGGGALYKIRNITNDDVVDEMFIVALNDSSNQLIAELIYSLPLDVRQIGIKSDGTLISDTLKNGLLKVNSIIFKDGSYNFNQLVIENVDGYNIDGENATLTTNSSLKFDSSENITIKNLNFNNNNYNCIIINDTNNVLIQNNKFTNSTISTIRLVRSAANTSCKNIKILDNNFISVSKTNTWGGAIYVDGQGKNGSDDTTQTLPIENIVVSNNYFYDIGTAGVNFGGVKNAIVENNIFENSYGTQNMLMTCTRESTELVISNNTFKGCGWECCILNYCNESTISGNYFEDFGYGVTCENECENINISNNVFNGMRNNRSHTGEGMQATTYGVLVKKSSIISINSNNIYDTSNAIFTTGGNVDISIIGNNITNSHNAVEYGGTSDTTDNNIHIKSNVCINNDYGMKIGTHGNASITNNYIDGNGYGIKLTQFNTDSNILIDGNYIKTPIGINEQEIYNIDCHQTITNNKIISSTTPLQKYAFNVNIGFINWVNPQITLDKSNIVTKFTKGSIVNYNEADFSTHPDESHNAGIGYYMQNVENGVVFIMSDGTWKRKTGGGGSSNITTSDW